MNELIQGYTNFFNDQINEMISEYRHAICVPMKQLLANDNAFAVTVHGVSEDRGHVVFRFDKRHAPRLKVQKSFVLVKRAARERWGESLYDWECSFEEFLRKDEYHTSSSFALPLYFMKSGDSDSLLVGCNGVSSRMFQKLKFALADGIKVYAIVYDSEPPVRYLANLVDYMGRNADDKVLHTKPLVKYDEWHPELLAYDKDDEYGMTRKLLDALRQKKCIVLQGPPGTGKSYCAAQVIADYLSRGQSVGAAAMANKALVELISQPPLGKYLQDGRLAKTMLTSDEAVAAKGLKDADSEYVVPKGEALFSTYYKLSNRFREIRGGNSTPLFDLIVVEEASQAYLATIAATLRLTKACLVVGDPMQLSPIVLADGKPEYKRWNAMTQSEGLSTFVLGTNVTSFRITTTFRLLPVSAELTGIFYGNTLRSVASGREGWQRLSGRYFPRSGGVVYEIMRGGEDGVLSLAAVKAMQDVLAAIENNRPGSTVAIITPFRDSAKAIQSKVSFDERKIDVSVETIDRIQGATVDYAIIYFPLRNAGFALEERRFNVATSRSRTTTLILSDFDLLEMRSVTGKVREFLEKVVGRDVDGEQPVVVKNECAQSGVKPVYDTSIAEGLLPAMENVEKLKRQVQKQLTKWLKMALPRVHPHGYWHSGVMGALTENQKINISRKHIRTLEELDLAALLSIFLNKGNLCKFSQIVQIEQKVEKWAELVKNIRNDYAHLDTKSIDSPDQAGMKYDMDTLAMFQRFLERTEPQLSSPEKREGVSSATTMKCGSCVITVRKREE